LDVEGNEFKSKTAISQLLDSIKLCKENFEIISEALLKGFHKFFFLDE